MIYYHFADLIYKQAEKYSSRTAIRYRDDQTGKWLNISWNGFAEKVRLTSQAMVEFGLKPQERIGIYAQNMPECYHCDFGGFGIRAISVPMYATSSPAQIEYIIRDADINLLFVGEQLQYNNAFKVQQETDNLLKQIVIFDPAVIRNPADHTSVYFDQFIRMGDNNYADSEVKIRRNEALADDIATIMYTSGTTGGPKGVILKHTCFLEAMRIHDIRLPMVNDNDLSVCFLPFTHIFEKAWSCYCFHKGVVVAVNRDPKIIQQTLPEINPTVMCNVPRFWEKVYLGVQEKINSSSGTMQKLFKNAIETGRKYNIDHIRIGLKPSLKLSALFHFYDKTVFHLLRKKIGIGRGRLFPVAGAPLADHITEFLLSVNIPVRYGYGLSETTATVCFFSETNYEIGSIGKIMPDVEVKISPENNEILVKGKTILTAYHNKPDDTAKSFTEDGFFRTGDAGRLEGDTLFFLERIKDLFKTSNGKYIAPQAIELCLSGNKYIEQCAVIADEHKFVSVLIVPSFPALEAYAVKNNIPFQNREALIAHDKIIRLYQSNIEECQKDFASYEKIKRFTLLVTPFSMETGELTDTLKLRRNVIAKNYASQISAMYE
ncbi:MAG: long-chain fatty acid--CoA ligase [Tannerella sp.]|jgi:long-chain acyl-CoA synthetase|nr:long-chain fatty acid--CoA ligase [Tannerella sp.]